MKTISIQSDLYKAQSKMTKNPEKIIKVKGLIEKKHINTLTPKFSYTNHEGKLISQDKDITL
ncbi:hypothetical protein [uncultured Lutibacter sp.]|uniref:hypothetical protein n=1 Tax=uncultured Lutibacter sp. TaxID=437739 RepID=UPI0026218EE2|nr:hypothetical protein [uncultured Lutibacter sp.]